jgi:crossover junction endodeoxyribonuclease RusA
MTEITLILPLPPSVNSYWGFAGSRRFLTLAAREFKIEVAHIVSHASNTFGDKRLSLTTTLHFKDRRKSDIDNRIKSLLDALVQAGLFDDDSQVDELHVYSGEIIRQGKAIVTISEVENKKQYDYKTTQ